MAVSNKRKSETRKNRSAGRDGAIGIEEMAAMAEL